VNAREIFVFDADCGVCTAFVGFVKSRATIPIQFMPWPDALEALVVSEHDIGNPPTTSAYVDHQGIAVRAVGIAKLLKSCRFPWNVIGRAFCLPGVRVLADLLYGVVARNRSRLPGSQCRIA
jgi:predicted DCC family thiol-disulfide oxidoreductase YuxK